VQKRLGDRLGKDVFFVSFSVDPANDTPEKLKEYAERFHAKPGWLFVTGTPENVTFALAKLGHKGAREVHQTVFMVLNDGDGLVKVGFDTRVTSDSLTQIVENALNKVRDQGSAARRR
jgi:protein SCO1/2